MTSRQIELALARYFNHRLNLIVPNVSWGLPGLGHECDMLIVRPSGFAVEVEIKVSRSDLKADMQKWHGHKSKLVRQLWFAVPEKLLRCAELVPEHAGILSAVTDKWGGIDIKSHRPARVNTEARPLTQEQRLKVSHLGCMRIWSLKHGLENMKEWRQRSKSEAATSPEQQ